MLQRGQRIDDYRIYNFFASGGMGEIYLAEEVFLNRQVVIKVIRPESIKSHSEDARRVSNLFLREATAIAKLSHPYILPLYRFGETTVDATPLMYMVMPYCQEKSLTDWMSAHSKTILSPQEAEPVVWQAAEALQYAHDQGCIHLDVKPSNFLVRYQANDTSRLNLQLADFGLAKFTATSGMSQTIRGSLEYMAPEQWEGQPSFATDQYALAIMIYSLLTGQLPFKGSGFEQLWHQHRYLQPQPPSSINPAIPSSIDAVLLCALAKNPNDRYPSIKVFANAYKQALQTQVGQTQYGAVHQTLVLSHEEASRGTNRMIVLQSGEYLPITITPGAYQGQIITIPRLYAPMVIITIHIHAVSAFSPRPSIPYYSSSPQNGDSQHSAPPQPFVPKHRINKTKLLILAGLLFALFLGTGVFLYNHYPNIVGTYSGSLQLSTDITPTQLTLAITQQNQQRFEGLFTMINSLFGTNSFTLEHGTVDRSGNIQFSITGTNLFGTTIIRTFNGTAQSGGGWKGTFSDTSGNQGTWLAS